VRFWEQFPILLVISSGRVRLGMATGKSKPFSIGRVRFQSSFGAAPLETPFGRAAVERFPLTERRARPALVAVLAFSSDPVPLPGGSGAIPRFPLVSSVIAAFGPISTSIQFQKSDTQMKNHQINQ